MAPPGQRLVLVQLEPVEALAVGLLGEGSLVASLKVNGLKIGWTRA